MKQYLKLMQKLAELDKNFTFLAKKNAIRVIVNLADYDVIEKPLLTDEYDCNITYNTSFDNEPYVAYIYIVKDVK